MRQEASPSKTPLREFRLSDPEKLNVLSLAYIGDSVWELFIRERVIDTLPDANHADYIHKLGVKYANASAQAKALKTLMNENFLSEAETALIKRARNHKVTTKAKNADVVTYKWATALEALIGKLYLEKDTQRLIKLMTRAAEILEEGFPRKIRTSLSEEIL